MIKSMKYSVLLAVVGALMMTGCDDLFDKGHTERAYDGPDQVAFQYLQNEIVEEDSQELTVQYISSEGEASSDVSVNLSVSADNIDTYNVSSTSVTIPSGSTSATITVDTSDDPDLDEDEEATIEVTIDSAEGAEVAPRLSTSTIFVTGG